MLSLELDLPLDELAELLEQARVLPTSVMEHVADELSGGLLLSAQMLLEYPSPRGEDDYPLRWVSARQFRAVMAKLRALGMEDGYQRTYTLQGGWSVLAEASGVESKGFARLGQLLDRFRGRLERKWEHELTISIGNEAIDPFGTAYAAYVQTREHQQPFHQDLGWEVVDDAIEELQQDAMSGLATLIDEALDQAEYGRT